MNINEKESNKPTRQGFLILLLMVALYVFVPTMIARDLIKYFNLNSNLSSMIGSVTLAIIFLIVFWSEIKKTFKEYISSKENFYTSLKYWLKGFGIMYISNIILVLLVFKGKIATNEEMNRQILKEFPAVAFFEIALIAPFVEEFIFRYALRKATGKNKYFPLITALIFGLLHSLTGISSWLDLLYTIPYGALGYMFGLAYNKTDNIFTSIVAHSVHNTLSFILIMLFA